MRILHTDTDDLQNPLRGGQPVRTFEVNSRLAREHDITVFTATYQGSQNNVVRENVRYERLGITIPKWGLSSHLSFLARLPVAIKRTQHDLIVEEFTPPFGFCQLEKYTDKPLISIVQWFFFDVWQQRYKLPFERIMQRRAQAKKPREIIVQTNKMGDYFKALLPDANVYKVPCGINESAFSTEESTGSYALFLGRLDTQHKGLDDLLKAWFLLKTQGVSIPLWIVGAGPDDETLKMTTLQLGLGSCVSFKGRLEGEEKNQALKNCRFLVMPSRQETFGLTALEAMAASKPVVAYDIDHLNELLQPAWSSVVGLGSIKDLASAVAELWQNPQKCLALGEAGYVSAKQYRWDEIARKQNEIYKHVAQK
jgi:glycosyltransferase involved in cell wall biosynthesis